MRKHLLFIWVAVLACTASFAQSTITLVSTTGSWNSKNDWDPARLPDNGDIIVIPATKTLSVDQNITATDVHLRVYGTVTLLGKATIVTLKGNSDVTVFVGGKIQGTEADQQLRIGNTVTYLGNNPPVVGPATASAALPTFQPIILPVRFLGFSLACQGSDVLVQWSTAEEVNSHSFEVERSTDGAHWSKIATLTAKGTSTTTANYSYTDRQVTAALAYYRIRQGDASGQYTYTPVKTIKPATANLEVGVTAINNRVVLQFSQEVKGAVEVRLVSLSGQVVSRQVIYQPVGQVVLNPSSVKGAYIIAVSNARDISLAKQVIL